MPRQLTRGFYLNLGKPRFRSAQWEIGWELVNQFQNRIKLNFALKVITSLQIGNTVIKKLFLQFETYLKVTFRQSQVRPSVMNLRCFPRIYMSMHFSKKKCYQPQRQFWFQLCSVEKGSGFCYSSIINISFHEKQEIKFFTLILERDS